MAGQATDSNGAESLGAHESDQAPLPCLTRGVCRWREGRSSRTPFMFYITLLTSVCSPMKIFAARYLGDISAVSLGVPCSWGNDGEYVHP